MTKQFVTNKDVSVRMFRSDFLERFTLVHPAVPHILYVPVIGFMMYASYVRGAGLLWGASMFLGGVLLWTLVEYLVHRFLFHVGPEVEQRTHEVIQNLEPGEPAIPAMKGFKDTNYFIAHGVHHDYPNDSRRLVMPPIVSIPLAFLFFFAFRFTLGATLAPAFFAGFVLGYLIYVTTHFAVHHWPQGTTIGKFLKKYHYQHHFVHKNANFGVSSPLWDYVFRTKS